MAEKARRHFLHPSYWAAEETYRRSLPPEHFMEATVQATQREIILESLAIVRAIRPEVHVFNELLVQCLLPRSKKLVQVVPDNMIVSHNGPIKARNSFNIPREPAKLFAVLECVSMQCKRKDHADNMRKYERELKVPYYLLCYPEGKQLNIFRHNKRKYILAEPNEHGRHAIEPLELEVAILDGWMRYWYRGKRLPLPGQLQQDLDESQKQLADLNLSTCRGFATTTMIE